MSTGILVLLVFAIGVIAGLRTMTAPAVVAWAARIGWLGLRGTPLAFMASTAAVIFFTAAALVELVGDQLPQTPPRTVPPQLIARIITGTFSGICLAVSGGLSTYVAALVGALGAMVGTFGGYRARMGLARALHVPDRAIAVPEDLIAIGTGLLVVSRM